MKSIVPSTSKRDMKCIVHAKVSEVDDEWGLRSHILMNLGINTIRIRHSSKIKTDTRTVNVM